MNSGRSGFFLLAITMSRGGTVPSFEKLGVVKDEPGVQFQLGNPAGRRLVAIKVDFPRTGSGKVMREALEVERSSAPHGERAFR